MAVPLSFAQQRLWFVDQLEPGQTAYNMPTAVGLEGKLDHGALRRAFEQIVVRHESLRTRFVEKDGVPQQEISEAGELVLPLVDVRLLGPEEGEREARRWMEWECRRPFDLRQGPLLRCQLWQIDEERHWLLCNMHHIISDGWSLNILLREMQQLYEAFSQGQASPLAELPIQYADYAVWQREQMQGEVLEEQLGFWRQQLTGIPELLQLPTDRQRLAVQTYRGARIPFLLSEELGQKLKSLARQEDVTLFITLLGVFQTLLYLYSEEAVIPVSTGIANRN
jgi:non-ribosomal peptide synthetase component F